MEGREGEGGERRPDEINKRDTSARQQSGTLCYMHSPRATLLLLRVLTEIMISRKEIEFNNRIN